MFDQKIIIIQNTEYHFETTISLYQILINIGFNVVIYRCVNIENKFNQISFLNKYNLPVVSLEDIESDMVGIVISAYPNPYVKEYDAIPNNNDYIFSKLSKFLYISHRFKNFNDYNGFINKYNALCLSPLSANIGIDYIYLTDMPVIPKYSLYNNDKIKLTIQGHFELAGRNMLLFKNIIETILDIIKNQKLTINILGTNCTKVLKYLKLKDINILNDKIRLHNFLDEDNFYYIMNNETDWLLPLITPELNNETYSLERYSSNFIMAKCFRKPIFCHEFFKNIYHIPGIYFNQTNLKESIRDFLNLYPEQYSNLLKEFSVSIMEWQNHNKTILNKKIQYVNQI